MTGGWSSRTGNSLGHKLHFFQSDDGRSRSVCGMVYLTEEKKGGIFVNDFEKYNPKKICKLCLTQINFLKTVEEMK